jgi:DNA-binding CsgD family transcriptional regulator
VTKVKSTALFHAVSEVAEAMIHADRSWPNYLVDELAALIGADTVGLATRVAELGDTPSANSGGPPLSVDERTMWAEYWWQYPFFKRLLQTGEGTAVCNSDMVGSMRAFRRTTVYGEHFEPRRARYQANLGWKLGNDLALVGLYRERRDFDREEIVELERVRQLLAAAAEYRSVLDQLGGPRVDLELSEHGCALSPRQQVVLSLVATGATNGQIAKQLRITERTVRKHVEDICRKLRVSNRVAAARWWLTSRPR